MLRCADCRDSRCRAQVLRDSPGEDHGRALAEVHSRYRESERLTAPLIGNGRDE
jgi:hypothetical protein